MVDVQDVQDVDAVVVGGGAAGLNAALLLARSRRSVVVVDGGNPRNAPAAAVHGLLGHDGTPPGELLRRGREEVVRYGGTVVAGDVRDARAVDGGFRVALADGSALRSRRLLVATGLSDGLPDVAGLAQRWGRDVLHCPYCHGWEVRDQAVAVLATVAFAEHQAQLFRQLTSRLVVLDHGAVLDDAARRRRTARGIDVVAGRVERVRVEEDALTGVVLADGREVACDALAVQASFAPRLDGLAGLGLPVADHPNGLGRHVVADATGRTGVPGVWAAGNVTDPAAQVGAAAAAGALAGAHVNADLVGEDVQRALAAHPA